MSDRQLSPNGLWLLRAADLIERKGHCKGVLWDKKGQHCLLGAIIDTAKHEEWSQVFHLVEAHLGEDPIIWNNACERTAEEVVAALRDVAMKELAP